MKKHNKTTMLYVADWVAMASLEQGGKTDWEAVSRGFDPCVQDEREGDFIQRVLEGKEQIGKIFLPMDEEVVPEFLELLTKEFPNDKFKTTRALPYIIEIVNEEVDKSAAMAYFCNKFDVKPENVMTFGDGENDVGMLTACGFGVSMGNAMAAPRNAAEYVPPLQTRTQLQTTPTATNPFCPSLSQLRHPDQQRGRSWSLPRPRLPPRRAYHHLSTLLDC